MGTWRGAVPPALAWSSCFVGIMLMCLPMLAFVRYAYEWAAFTHSLLPPIPADAVRGAMPPLIGGVPAIFLLRWIRPRLRTWLKRNGYPTNTAFCDLSDRSHGLRDRCRRLWRAAADQFA